LLSFLFFLIFLKNIFLFILNNTLMEKVINGHIHVTEPAHVASAHTIGHLLIGATLPLYAVNTAIGNYYIKTHEAIQSLIEQGRHEVARLIEANTWGLDMYPIPIAACEFVPA
jgi:hypothetical protein